MIDINYEIQKLIEYSIYNNLITKEDEIFIRNQILEVIGLDDFVEQKVDINEIKDLEFPCEILDRITKYAAENNLLKENILVYEDILNATIMGRIINRPSIIRKEFWEKYRQNKELATEYFYDLSRKSNYIRTDRIAKNISYKYETKYGELDITINLSKPEKDPKEIALARNQKSSSYPKNLLTKENEGYYGRINHPARANHRIIELELNNEPWFFQYSPYSYYNEHSIVFSGEIRPMKIDRSSFVKLLDFVTVFPHYFIGSNADLPIVGGSILSHDHFQAGRYTFAMETALKTFVRKIKDVEVSVVKWPMSVIRLNSTNKDNMIDLASEILDKWIMYSQNGIVSHTDGVRHNTITPIARQKDGVYELDLVLRNNLTSDEYPLGIYHPHSEYHNIKKENIGLIEVMGLAVLPSRLKDEMHKLDTIIKSSTNLNEILNKIDEDNDLLKHKEWIQRYVNDENIKISNVYDFVGDTFSHVLEDCSVLNEDKIKEFIERL
ncbi:UDP-glucose--hexose-1-phosphate uridylyltransferase [Oceanivirga miroungae]|uniref:Galactose-1-phosphate uridylyltransferase n=1 Tax=Oceanivirga miroungae TaxID=1130046 RepID=A0A6I8MCK3_9FUSO|nr:UDP-glucose--hexose-1-phosphate uridylyltransferase [Oceanivirga miroungae]VWL84849.1 galactose-1-phosphate uridylyltransferase [Oceanivirga miroungae]